MLHQNLVFKYKLNDDKEQNKRILQSNIYIFGDELINQVLYGEYVHIENLTDKNALNVENYRTTRRKVNTHKNGLQFLHSVDSIKTVIGISTSKVKVILERLFRKKAAKENSS